MFGTTAIAGVVEPIDFDTFKANRSKFATSLTDALLVE